ncbi:IBR domain protein, partial [Ostertagia ostertagi]
MDDIVLCPRARCQNPASKSNCTATLATCQVCDFSFCVKCRRAYHGVNRCQAVVVAVSRMVENEDGTLTFKEITVDEYLAATDDQRKEMAWWYGGVKNLEAAMDEAMGLNDR